MMETNRKAQKHSYAEIALILYGGFVE